jgi:type IV pilus assembly protein PilM
MNAADLDAAVKLEAEQYVPVPLPDLYIDYEVVEQQAEHSEVLMVAAPRAIVDSYIKLFDLMGLEVAAIESSLSAMTRALLAAAPPDRVTLLADIGSSSIDLAIYDKVVRLTDTIAVGGDTFTTQLMKDLGVTREQANEVKFRFGLGPSGLQSKIEASLKKSIDTVCSEMKRVLRYYAERSANKRTVEAIVVAGGSASLPGLVDRLSKELGLSVTIADPWEGLVLKHIQQVTKLEGPMYTTAIGLARREGSND